MGLHDDIVTDISQAFNTDLADAVESVTITQYARDAYDPTTGDVTKTITNQQTTRGVYTGAWQYEVYNSSIDPRDESFLMLQADISFVPDIGSFIESTVRGKARIDEVRIDPVNATYEFRIRY